MSGISQRGGRMSTVRWIAAFVGTVALLSLVGCCTTRQPQEGPGLGQARLMTIEGPQGKLLAEDGGRGGVPVLFVHGLAADHRVWTDQLQHLRTSRRAIALDLRGHGGSQPAANGDYSIEGFAQDVQAVADTLHLSRFVLVGHSMGGLVVTAYAGQHPLQVAGVLYADPAGDLTGQSKKDIDEWLASLAPDKYATSSHAWFKEILQNAPPAVQEQVLASLDRTSPDVVRAAIRGLVAYDPKADLRAYKGPRLTVITPLNEKPYSLQNLVPDLPFTVMTGTSHWLMMDKPAEFDTIMDSFLTKVKG